MAAAGIRPRRWPIVQTLRAQGYCLVTVSELLNTEGARPVLSQTCYDVRPGDTDHYDRLARRLDRAAEAFKLRYVPAAAAQRAEAARRAWGAPTRLQPRPPPAVGP